MKTLAIIGVLLSLNMTSQALHVHTNLSFDEIEKNHSIMVEKPHHCLEDFRQGEKVISYPLSSKRERKRMETYFKNFNFKIIKSKFMLFYYKTKIIISNFFLQDE